MRFLKCGIFLFLVFALIACGTDEDEGSDSNESTEESDGISAIIEEVTLNRLETDSAFDAYRGIPIDTTTTTAYSIERDITRVEDVAEGVTQGFTADGIPYIGSLDAPVVIADFSDFACPHCQDFAFNDGERVIQEYVRAGLVRFEYYPITFVAGERSQTAAYGALCAGQQGAFWEFHKELFNIQKSETSQAFTLNRMVEIATSFGLDGIALGSCLRDTNQTRAALTATQNLQNALGVNSVPSIFFRPNTSDTWTKIDNRSYDNIVRQITPYLTSQ